MSVPAGGKPHPPAMFPPLPDPPVPPWADEQYLVGLIAEITGQPRDAVAGRLRREEAWMGSNVRHELEQWGVEPYVWSERLVAFYSQSDAFLYESLVWNRTPQKNGMRKWIAAFLDRDFGRPARVLTHGDGLGFDSLCLAQAGHDVWYFEVSEKCLRFARSIFAAAGVQVRMLQAPEEIAREHFDVVVCLDVLEHVPDPPATVAQLAAALRPGGRMIVHAPFYYVAPRVGTHLRCNTKYSGNLSRIYAPQGLRLIDGRLFWDPIVLEKRAPGSGPVRRPTWRTRMLYGSGLLLATARYWSAPHSWIAGALARAADKKGSAEADGQRPRHQHGLSP